MPLRFEKAAFLTPSTQYHLRQSQKDFKRCLPVLAQMCKAFGMASDKLDELLPKIEAGTVSREELFTLEPLLEAVTAAHKELNVGDVMSPAGNILQVLNALSRSADKGFGGGRSP